MIEYYILECAGGNIFKKNDFRDYDYYKLFGYRKLENWEVVKYRLLGEIK